LLPSSFFEEVAIESSSPDHAHVLGELLIVPHLLAGSLHQIQEEDSHQDRQAAFGLVRGVVHGRRHDQSVEMEQDSWNKKS
jgi:hypothetical protein